MIEPALDPASRHPSRVPGWKRGVALPMLFAIIATCTVSLALLYRFEQLAVDAPSLFATALAIDLTISLPIIYYLLIVRGGGWSALTVLPFFVLCHLAARAIIPNEHPSVSIVQHMTLLPVELGVLTFVVWKVQRGVRALKREFGNDHLDRLDAIQSACSAVIRQPFLLRILTFEISVLYFSLLVWRVPTPPNQPHLITVYRRCGYLTVMLALQMAVMVELVGIHLLVQHFVGSWLAWILTGLSLYGSLWLIADWNAMRLCPIQLQPDQLRLRVGFRWACTIDAKQIQSIEKLKEPVEKPSLPTLNAAVIGSPNLQVTLDDPVTIDGAYGIRRTVSIVQLQVDQAEEFLSWWQSVKVSSRK